LSACHGWPSFSREPDDGCGVLRKLAELARGPSPTPRNWDLYTLATEVLSDCGGADSQQLEDAFCADLVGRNDQTQEDTWELLVRLLELTGAVLLYDGTTRAYAGANGVAAHFDLGLRLDPFSTRGPVATWRSASAQLVHPEGVWHAF
jgi:hypothetical protein